MLMLWSLEMLKALNDKSHREWEERQKQTVAKELSQMGTAQLEQLQRTAGEILDQRRQREGPFPGPKPPKQDPHFEGSLKPGGVPRDAMAWHGAHGYGGDES